MKITITIDIEEKKIDTEKENIKKELRELLMEAEKKGSEHRTFLQ